MDSAALHVRAGNSVSPANAPVLPEQPTATEFVSTPKQTEQTVVVVARLVVQASSVRVVPVW